MRDGEVKIYQIWAKFRCKVRHYRFVVKAETEKKAVEHLEEMGEETCGFTNVLDADGDEVLSHDDWEITEVAQIYPKQTPPDEHIL